LTFRITTYSEAADANGIADSLLGEIYSQRAELKAFLQFHPIK